jgi:hypothetical protein
VKGYAAYDGQAGQFHVSEIGGYDGRTFGSLANALARRARRSGAESVRFHLPPNDAFGAFCIRYGCAWSIWYPSNAGSMGRIVQLGPLIEKLQPEFSRRLHRAGADWKGMLAIETDIGSVGLRIDGSNVVATQETQASTLNVRVPQMLLTQLVLGYRDVVEVACDTGVQLPVRSVPIMAALFPKGHPFMWWSDRF